MFGRYGYTVEMRPAPADKGWLDDSSVRAVITDASDLFADNGQAISPEQSSGRATNRCTVWAWIKQNGAIEDRTYIGVVEGMIVAPQTDDPDVFAWDDRFVPNQLGRTLHIMKLSDAKCSARDVALSHVVANYMDYKKDKSLQWFAVPQDGLVDLSEQGSVQSFVSENPYLQISGGLKDIMDMAVQNGIFFRRKLNRRAGNYWAPGLNAGIGFTPKRDPIHEITYLFHDIMHHAVPDLVFDGVSSDTHRKVYCLSRMLSEAFSLVLADMLFVQQLVAQGVEYDWTKRVIYPLFKDLDGAGWTHHQILHGIWSFVCGNYESMPQSGPRDAFQMAYAPFFVADWRWSRANWDALSQRSDMAARWVQMVGGEATFNELGLMTVSQAIERMGVQVKDSDAEIAAQVFQYWAGVLAHPEQHRCQGSPVGNAARRYLLGQIAAFARYQPLVQDQPGFDTILGVIQGTSVEPHDVVAARDAFDGYVDMLQQRHAISPDDARIFRTTFPLFDPFFVSYNDGDGTIVEQVTAALQ